MEYHRNNNQFNVHKTMNPLHFILLAGAASFSMVAWQQSAIERIRGQIDSLSNQLISVRRSMESEQLQLADARRQLDRVRTDNLLARQNQAVEAEKQLAALTPQSEGWWPASKPYFYLAKTHLPKVAFRQQRLPIAEVNALATQRAKTLNPNISLVTTSPDEHGEGTFCARLLEAGKLNRDFATLLGMSESEAQQVDSLYTEFRIAARNVEASRIERLDPPVPYKKGFTGQIIARMPSLTEDMTPLLDELNRKLDQALGSPRSAILKAQANDYFKAYMDSLGALSREFVRMEGSNTLVVESMERWGVSQAVSSMPLCENDDYGHLFPPGWNKH